MPTTTRRVNPLRLDPTRTTMLRKAFVADVARRCANLRRAIHQLVEVEDAFGLKPRPGGTLDKLVSNTRWTFATDAEKLENYRTWLKTQTDAGLLGVSAGNVKTPWMEPYLTSGYKKGLVRAYADTHRLGDMPFVEGGKKAFLDMTFNAPVGQSKLKLLSTRAFSQMQGVTAEMDKEMSRVLAQGLSQGHGARAVARDLQKTVTTIERKRARTIARTELIHAHSEGQLDAFEAMNVEGVGVMAEWSTAGDDLVCGICAPLEGVILTVAEARGIIPRHPNCRCTWIPADIGEHKGGTTTTTWSGEGQGLAKPGTVPTGKKTGQVHSGPGIEDRIRESIKAEHPKLPAWQARAASRWLGADLKVTGKLKPGSKKYLEAKAAARARAIAKAAAKKKAAEEAAAAAKAAHSLKIKVGMVKKKYGITDDMLTEIDGNTRFTAKGAGMWVEQHGVEWAADDWAGVYMAGLNADAGVPMLKAQAEALGKLVNKKLAHKVNMAKFTEDAKAAVAAWGNKLPVTISSYLDEIDYSDVVGWGVATGKRRQSYGIIIFDDSGRVLMREPKNHYGGAHWTFAKGGGIKPGSTAFKELAEETGWTGEIYDILPGKFKGTQTKTNYFVGKGGKFDAALMDAETANTKWMTYEEALEAIAKSPDPAVVARDTDVLNAAYKLLATSDGKKFDAMVSDAITKVAVKTEKAAKAAHAHKVKLGMAKKHFAKKKFGGGVVDADWVNPATQQKLNTSGINKVLSEKGWHTTTLPKATTEALEQADDVVAQKAIIDGLKNAPKGTTPPGPARIAVPLERDLTKVRDLPGSTRPYLARDGNGKGWVVKDVNGSGIAPAHLRSEGLADDLYRVMDLDVPAGAVVDTPGGPMKITEFLEGGQTLSEWKAGKTATEIKEMYQQIQKGFVSDALLANHDVAGMSFDNIMVVGGKAYRIDNGGALTFRAQGGAKRSWGAKVTELESMRDKSINAQTAELFADITDEEIERQIRQVVARRDAILATIPDDDVRATMAARIDNLNARLPKGAAPARRGVPDGASRAEYGVSPTTPDRVRAARSNGVTLSVDRDEIEDLNALAWEELGVDGRPLTMVQFKATKKGSDNIIRGLGKEFDDARAAGSTVVGKASTAHPDDVYWDDILKAAKTVNHHASDGQYNAGTINVMEQAKVTIQAELKGATGAKKEMLEHYIASIEEIEEAMNAKKAMASTLHQYVHTPPKPTAPAPVPARRKIKVHRGDNIQLRVSEFSDGVGSRSAGNHNIVQTKEAYVIDADEGVKIHFVPRDATIDTTDGLALQGTVQITVPGEVSQASMNKALDIVKQIGLDTAPPTQAYEEALYLHRGVYLRNMHEEASYRAIWLNTGITDEERVVQMKGWIKKNMKIDVDTRPGYDPAGVARHADGSGFRYWRRWDLSEEDVINEMDDHALLHTTHSLSDSPRGATADTLDKVLNSGGEFSSTTGRMRKGVRVTPDDGASPYRDIETGGGSYFFTRIKRANSDRHGFFFRITTLNRQDTVSYPSDRFGRISSIQDRAVDIKTWKKYAKNYDNETLFKEGLSLADLDFIRVRPGEVDEVIRVFKKHGIDTLPDGRRVEDIVTTTTEAPKARRP